MRVMHLHCTVCTTLKRQQRNGYIEEESKKAEIECKPFMLNKLSSLQALPVQNLPYSPSSHAEIPSLGCASGFLTNSE